MSSGQFISTAVQRQIVLTAAILALSGCAGVTELARDVITGLADIDVSGVTDLFGGGKVELTPEQTAQLAKIPPARALWRSTIEESQAAVFFPVFETDAVYAASSEGRLVRFNPVSRGRRKDRLTPSTGYQVGLAPGKACCSWELSKARFLHMTGKTVNRYGLPRFPARSRAHPGQLVAWSWFARGMAEFLDWSWTPGSASGPTRGLPLH